MRYNQDLFVKQLISLREEKNMTQTDLAFLLQLGQGAVSKYENGKSEPPLNTLVEIAAHFNVSVDYLLGLSSIKNPYSSDKFTPREAEIIARYRKLIPENKIRIDERINAMIDGQRQK